MRALVFENRIVDLQEAEFPCHASMEWIDAPDGAAIGDEWDGAQYVKPRNPADDMTRTESEEMKLLKLLYSDMKNNTSSFSEEMDRRDRA